MDWWQVALLVLASVVVGFLVGGLLSYLIARIRKKPFILFVKKHDAIAVAEKLSESTATDLLTELEDNYRIAAASRADEMSPFKTHAWDANQGDVHRLRVNLREELAQAYLDMHQANDIVWLSTELGHRSQTLDQHYMNLCPRIAARLERVIPALKGSGS